MGYPGQCATGLQVSLTHSSPQFARMRGIAYPVEQVGLKLNASKTKVLTTQAQPRSTLTTAAGLELEVLEPTISYKWLGCL